MKRYASFALTLLALLPRGLNAQTPVTYDRLSNPAKEPRNWLTYGGDYFSGRFSPLTQVTPANVKSLGLAWVYQSAVAGSWESTPLVVDGIMYVTQRPNDVVALDAVTGRVFWIYHYNNDPNVTVCKKCTLVPVTSAIPGQKSRRPGGVGAYGWPTSERIVQVRCRNT